MSYINGTVNGFRGIGGGLLPNIAALAPTSISATDGLQSTPSPITSSGSIAWIGYSSQETIISYSLAATSPLYFTGNIIQQMNAVDPATWLETVSSANFTYDPVAGTITCNTTGLYLLTCLYITGTVGDVEIKIDGNVVPGTVCAAWATSTASTVPVFITSGQVITLVTGFSANFYDATTYGASSCIKLFRLG